MAQLIKMYEAIRKCVNPLLDNLARFGRSNFFLIALLFLAACTQELGNNSGTVADIDSSSDNIAEADSSPVDTTTEGIPASTIQTTPDSSQPADSDIVGGESIEGETTMATVTPEIEKQIVVCLGNDSISLFPYSDESLASVALRHAIYENLYTTVGYDYQAQGLEKLPSLEDGDAVVRTVTVEEGDLVKDINGKIVKLVNGVTVVNAEGQTAIFDGLPIDMEQMVVDFTFHPMFWSDGIPVTARDSVFSFDLASDPQIVLGAERTAATERYEEIGERSVRWTGVPGHRDQMYFLNVWQPLPSHQLSRMSAAELKLSDLANKMPLSNGPYVIDDWVAENEVILVRNEHYYRQDEGFPIIDRIIVRFGVAEEFFAAESQNSCDIIADGAMRSGDFPLIEMATEDDTWQMVYSPGLVYEHIAFGINPTSEYADRRPDWFEDAIVRQAMTLCTDRQRMIDELTGGRAELLHAYVSEQNQLFPSDLQKWPYDPIRANEMLDEAGYLDFSDDGRRQDVSSGIPMTITLGTNSESPLRLNISEIFQENMADCGIPVETYDFPAGTWFAEGPIGRLFGRRFDLAQFAWIGKSLPDCGLYLTDNIPGPTEAGYGGWQNTNVTGWSNGDFDNECLAALEAMPGNPDYDEHQREALRIFARELPAIPLFTNLKFAAVRPWMINLQLDPSQASLLWNIHEWDIER